MNHWIMRVAGGLFLFAAFTNYWEHRVLETAVFAGIGISLVCTAAIVNAIVTRPA